MKLHVNLNKANDPIKLTPEQLDSLKELGNIGSGNDVVALSELINKKIEVSLTGIKIIHFWDLNNITFSHLKCNRPNRPAGGDKRVGDKNPAAKKYIITTPEGEEILVHGIANFCKNYGKEQLEHRRLIDIANGKQKYHKGYKCKYY